MKHLRQYIRQIIIESIPLDIKVGDIILTGKFKNKRTIVKSIGKDEYGHPTINGKSILKFKIEKNLPKKKWSAKSREELKEEIGRNYHTVDPTSFTWDDYTEANVVTRVDPHEEKWFAKIVVKNRPDLSTKEQSFANEEEAIQWGRNIVDKIRVILMNDQS